MMSKRSLMSSVWLSSGESGGSGLRHPGFRAGGLLANHDAQAMDIARQNGQCHIAFESDDPMIRAQIESEMLQAIDRGFHRGMLVPRQDKLRCGFPRTISGRVAAFFG